MNTSSQQHQLLSELNELHQQNKQWLSEVNFLEDEIKIFRKIYDQFFSAALKEDQLHEIQHLNFRLNALETHRKELKNLVNHHQSLLEMTISNPEKAIGFDLIEDHTKIINDIKALFATDISVKKELYAFIEGLLEKEKASHLLSRP